MSAATPIRAVAMDHFFDQDLRALEADPRIDLRRVPYQRFRRTALRIMTDQISEGLEGFNNPALEAQRQRYARWLKSELRRIYLESAFDVFILPSDTFFYVRALPDALHSLGIPLVVVQKETTISADTMAKHSHEQGAEAPFVSDLMTVSSERHKQFWLRAGTDGDKVMVTGQPRFDAYAEAAPPDPGHRPRKVLFLSYFLDAYVPRAEAGRHDWTVLRGQTESALIAAAKSGDSQVTIKCHPQERRTESVERLRKAAGAIWGRGLAVADIDADTRRLIVDADIVVGFQTTALYEAVAARRPVLYAAWGDDYEALRPALIPFEEAPPQCLVRAEGPDDLLARLRAPIEPARSGACRAWVEEALGPIDGQATDRVVKLLQRIVEAWPAGLERARLDRLRRLYSGALVVSSGIQELGYAIAEPLSRLANQQGRVSARRRYQSHRRRLAIRGLRPRPPG
jgi:hypothetical protein